MKLKFYCPITLNLIDLEKGQIYAVINNKNCRIGFISNDAFVFLDKCPIVRDDFYVPLEKEQLFNILPKNQPQNISEEVTILEPFTVSKEAVFKLDVGKYPYNIFPNKQFSLNDKTLNNVNFADMKFYKKDISNFNSTTCSFEHAQLTDFKIKNSTFFNVNFQKTIFSNIQLDLCRFEDNNFQNAEFYQSPKLENALFIHCNFKEAKFDKTTLKNICFSDCDFKGIRFENVSLNDVMFELCFNLKDINLQNTKIIGVQVDGLKLLNNNNEASKLKTIYMELYKDNKLGPVNNSDDMDFTKEKINQQIFSTYPNENIQIKTALKWLRFYPNNDESQIVEYIRKQKKEYGDTDFPRG